VKTLVVTVIVWGLLLCPFSLQRTFGQGYGDSLTIQGLDHNTIQSAASRASGGATILLQDEVGLMFSNPASLQSLKGIRVSVGGLQHFVTTDQIQQYSPLKYYSNFSLLMEGLTGYIPNPDTSGDNPGDTVQRPYDMIGPNWSHSGNKGLPIQALIGVPLTIGGSRFTAGLGVVQYENLNQCYQNNNVLSPSIGSERSLHPVLRPPNDSTPTSVQWYQYLRSRDGSIRGYGVSLSGSASDKISFGLSGMILKGSTDDYEQRVGRGTLVFYTNYFRLDSVYQHVTRTGTSDYSGQEFTLSGIYRGRYLSLGFSVKPPTTITRTYSTIMQNDTTGLSSTITLTGEDKVQLPWRGTAGMSIAVAPNVTFGLEYEIRSFESAVYTDPTGKESSPWLSASVLHVGAEYHPLPWLALRAGMRGQAEVFQEEGNPIDGEPVSYSIYSAGFGVSYQSLRLNIAYEYGQMKYQDLWQTNVNINIESRYSIVADVVYEVPPLW